MKIFTLLMLPCSLLTFPCSPLIAVAQTAAPVASAPVWTMQDSGVKAGLRGIHSLDGKIVWASGSGGTVLHTIDGGEHWTKCEIPGGKKDGKKLDFRGIQTWDAKTAIVMSSGPGQLSRLYKTTDGCASWQLLFMNVDKDGFWDSFKIDKSNHGWLLGDPVNGKFTLFYTYDGGKTWTRMDNQGLEADAKKQGAFAASNSSLLSLVSVSPINFVTGGTDGANIYFTTESTSCYDSCDEVNLLSLKKKEKWVHKSIPIGSHTEASGVFSIGVRGDLDQNHDARFTFVAVGGDYTKPNETSGTAAWAVYGVQPWKASEKPPHGYRSTVQWTKTLKAWIAAGTNGSDFSRDDGKTWTPLDDGNWNAMSLPFIVGPNGRIGRIDVSAFPAVIPQAPAPEQ